MINISQKEAEYLRSKGRGFDIHTISKTHKGRAKRYYMTTRYKTIEILNEYRKSVHQTDLYIDKNKKNFNF